ncbi:MAG: RNA recognition motif domain-containing protein [Salibacteraceae bacterium]
MNIFVARLAAETTSEDLNDLFSAFGAVSSAKVIIDRETGHSKRYGFVEMDNDDEGYAAIENLNESSVDGSNIVVKKARPRTENSGGGGFRGGGGGGYRGGGGGGGYRDGGRDGGYQRGNDNRNRGGGRDNRRGGFSGGGNDRDYDSHDRY